MNFCSSFMHQFDAFIVLINILASACAFSYLAKKKREESLLLSVTGIVLFAVVIFFLPMINTHIHNMAPFANMPVIQMLMVSLMDAFIIAVLMTLLGKHLKVKAVAPKLLVICFFIGFTVASLVGMSVKKQCTPCCHQSHHQA